MPFSDNAKRFKPWSISKLDCAKQCGRRFFLLHVDKVKEDKGRIDSKQRIGTAAHKVLELIVDGRALLDACKVAAVDTKLTSKEIEDLMIYQGNFRQFLERLESFKINKQVTDQFVEHKFGLTIDFRPTKFFGNDVFFRGVWDLGLYLASKNVVIIDHKTSTPEDSIEKYNNQLNVYAISGRAVFPTIEGAQSAIHYVQNNSIVWGDYIPAKEIDERLNAWLIEYVNSCVEKLDRTATPGWYCDFCGYSELCPAKAVDKG